MSAPAFHDPPRLPPGFGCTSTLCGIKREGRDLALFAADRPCVAAAVFTRNRVPGAPVVVGRELIREGVLQAVVVNSRVANVGTGPEGERRARRMGAAAARELGIPVERVLMSSTGVIGLPLPIDAIEAGLDGLASELQGDPLVGARGIMTTDTHPKAVSLSLPTRDGEAVLTAVGKGSGMIAPDMATMLVYLFTDAEVTRDALDAALRSVVDRTFNMLSVDGDTSTSDTCAVLASGGAGPVGEARFRDGLERVCERMTEMLARDGEGATRLLRVSVSGAAGEDEARTVARSVARSLLVKTMVHGGDPNVGRILMAVGKCVDCRIAPDRVDVRLGGVRVMDRGRRTDFDEGAARAHLLDDPVELQVELGVGDGSARAWGCDLGPGYVEENAAYYST